MAENEIIRNTVKKTLSNQGRSRKWLKEQLIEQGIDLKVPAFGNIMNNTTRSITLHQIVTISRILEIPDFRDLLEPKEGLFFDPDENRIKEYKSKIE